MDTDTLVEELVADGRKLIELLLESELDVAAACWVKTSEEGTWLLYIATDEVDKKGLAAAYREVYRLLRAIPSSWVSTSDIKLVGRDNPVAKDLLDVQRRFPGNLPTRSRSLRLASISTEEIYLYPPPKHPEIPLRQSFTVSYYRQGDSNSWSATTKREELYRGMKAEGAVGYSTFRWAGEKEGDETHASVSVLLEVDPRFDRQNVVVHPSVWKVLANQAREMADEMFKARHPEAEIVHHEIDDG